jgi:hypothetical protein
LVEAAIEAEATDNITAVVLRIGQFVPIADEPTLAPIPTMVAAAPILTAAPISTPTQPAQKEKGGIPRWLIILAIIAIILITAALLTFWLQNRNVSRDSSDTAATATPEIVESPSPESTGALRVLELTATVESPAETGEPLPTETIQPPGTPTPRSTPTVAVISEPRGCANGDLIPFVRTDEQFNAGCTTAFMQLEAGDEVRILSSQSVAPGGNCGPGQFIKIQSINDAVLEGWVHQDAIDLIATGESCSP